MDFRPLAEAERRQLLTALRGNADRGLALASRSPRHQLHGHGRGRARRAGDHGRQVGPVPLLEAGRGRGESARCTSRSRFILPLLT